MVTMILILIRFYPYEEIGSSKFSKENDPCFKTFYYLQDFIVGSPTNCLDSIFISNCGKQRVKHFIIQFLIHRMKFTNGEKVHFQMNTL